MNSRMTVIAMLLTAAVALSGCTSERAAALKAGAERFATQASSAIDAAVDLHIRGALGKKMAAEDGIRESSRILRSAQENDDSKFLQKIPDAFDWVDRHEKFREKSFATAKDLKLAYAEFAAAYENLPEGSILAHRDVACSAALAARLIGQMTEAARTLAKNRVPLVYEQGEGRLRLRDAAKASQLKNDWSSLEREIRSYYELLLEQDRLNLEVVAKLTDAAETGAEVLTMIDKYDDVSAEDLVSVLKSALKVRESTFGLSSSAQLQRLDDISDKIKSKPGLSTAFKLPVNATPVQCSVGA